MATCLEPVAGMAVGIARNRSACDCIAPAVACPRDGPCSTHAAPMAQMGREAWLERLASMEMEMEMEMDGWSMELELDGWSWCYNGVVPLGPCAHGTWLWMECAYLGRGWGAEPQHDAVMASPRL